MVINNVIVTVYSMKTYHNIRLSLKTKTKLEKIGHKGDTFDEIVNRVLEGVNG